MSSIYSDMELFGAMAFLSRSLRIPPTAYHIAKPIATILAINGDPLSVVAPSKEPIANNAPMTVGIEYLIRGNRFNGGMNSTMTNKIMNAIPEPTIWPKRTKTLSIAIS